MVIFAALESTAGNAMQRLLTNLTVVLAISTAAIILGARLLRNTSSVGKKCAGALLLLIGCLLPFFWNVAGFQGGRLDTSTHTNGGFPGDKIKEGMSRDEVRAILGPPHQRKKNHDRETWTYWSDAYDGYAVTVDFGPDGRVTNSNGK